MAKFITLNGKEILCQKIRFVEEKLKHVMSQKGDAYENGGNGWHDNFSFEQLVREEAMLAGELSSLNDILDHAVIVPSSPVSLDEVSIGCIITLQNDDEISVEYEVVGYGETDMSVSPKRLEYLAPVVSPFMGGKIGEEHEVRVSGRQVNFTLTHIRKKE